MVLTTGLLGTLRLRDKQGLCFEKGGGGFYACNVQYVASSFHFDSLFFYFVLITILSVFFFSFSLRATCVLSLKGETAIKNIPILPPSVDMHNCDVYF